MRTCATISRDECKEEKSGETFCFCKNDLCNTPDPKLSDVAFGMSASQHTTSQHPRREGVARALQSSSSLNSATTDDEDLTKFGSKNKIEASEGSGDSDSEGDENYYDTTYFGEYDEDDEDSDAAKTDEDSDASPPGDVDMTEPPPFIVEEEIANWNSKFGDGTDNKSDNKSIDKKVDKKENADNDIDFEESDESKDRKTETGNVHSPTDRKHIINRAAVLGSNTALSILTSQLAFIVMAKMILL